MAHGIIERPAAFCMSKNEIRYVYRVTDLSRIGLYLEVQLFYCRTDGTTDSSLPSFKLMPNPDGTVVVPLQLYIDSLLTYTMPTGAAFYTAATTQSCSFYVAVREVEDTTLGTVAWDTSESTSRRIALKMGMENNRYSRNNLINYLTTNKLFLTWQPNHRKVFVDQPVFISFFNSSGTTENIQFKVYWNTIQGTANSKVLSLGNITGYIIHLKVDINTLVLSIPAGEDFHYWQVSIIDTTTSVTIISPYRFYKDFKPIYHYFDFIYVTSLGGIDTARAAGETTFTIDRTFDVAEGGFNVNNWSNVVKAHAVKQVNVYLQRKWKGDLGFRQDKNEQSGFMDLLLCKLCYTIIDGNWVPILNLQSSVEIRKTTDTKWSFPIEWEIAETNEAYTPETVALGMGSDTETYLGTVALIINSANCNVHYVVGLTGFELPGYDNTITASPIIGKHSNATTADNISLFVTISGFTHYATLAVNGNAIETITLPNESYIFFTNTLAIAISDIVEIMIN